MTIQIDIDDETWEEDFPGVDQVELECEFYYEPADQSVGIMRDHVELEQVTRTDTQETFSHGDLKTWSKIEDIFTQAFWDHVQEQRDEAAIAAYENQQAYSSRF